MFNHKVHNFRAKEIARMAQAEERAGAEFKEKEAARQAIYAKQAATKEAMDREAAEQKRAADLAASHARLIADVSPDSPVFALRTRMEKAETEAARLRDELQTVRDDLAALRALMLADSAPAFLGSNADKKHGSRTK